MQISTELLDGHQLPDMIALLFLGPLFGSADLHAPDSLPWNGAGVSGLYFAEPH